MTTGTSRRRDEKGMSTPELVLIAPALLVLIFLGAQFALWYFAGSVATTAARDGANAGAAGNAGGAVAYNRATSVISGPGAGVLTATVAVTATGQTVTVKVDGNAVSLIPGMSLPVHATAATPAESFTTERP